MHVLCEVTNGIMRWKWFFSQLACAILNYFKIMFCISFSFSEIGSFSVIMIWDESQYRLFTIQSCQRTTMNICTKTSSYPCTVLLEICAGFNLLDVWLAIRLPDQFAMMYKVDFCGFWCCWWFVFEWIWRSVWSWCHGDCIPLLLPSDCLMNILIGSTLISHRVK